jgi:crotonobetainyl-CoA:carnitine CoA-transferase CaiB-like acyl-CoA transferase
MFLGDFGADVVKVEPPGGDFAADRPGYETFARNKKVLTLDLTVASDLATAKTLIAAADVVVFDHAPGKLEALGLDGDTLCSANPTLIHAWMPPYGVRGKWSQLPPRQSLIAALTGMSFRQGAYRDTPRQWQNRGRRGH